MLALGHIDGVTQLTVAEQRRVVADVHTRLVREGVHTSRLAALSSSAVKATTRDLVYLGNVVDLNRRDPLLAAQLLNIAAAEGHRGAQYGVLMLALQHGLFDLPNDDMVAMVRGFAEDPAVPVAPTATYALASILYEGRLVPRDLEGAYAWYCKAAEAGVDAALLNAAAMQLVGEGTPKDVAAALQALEKAALEPRNSMDAQLRLGDLFLNGQPNVPLEANAAASLKWYQLAADQGSPRALFNIGMVYLFGDDSQKAGSGSSVKKDTERGRIALETAANRGFGRAQFNLGKMYVEGKVLPKDVEKARAYLQLAAQSNPAAAELLATLPPPPPKRGDDCCIL